MATFKVDIEKLLNGEYWTNRYIITGSSEIISDFLVTANAIMEAERLFHSNLVLFTRHRISSLPEGDDVYITTPLNVNGARATSSSLLSLFNTVRVDFPAGFGRPSRKYYRGVLAEGDVDGTVIAASIRTTISNALAPLTPGALVDPQGATLQDGIVFTNVQMRQLRRGRKRPIIAPPDGSF